jgi:hypothetical protein
VEHELAPEILSQSGPVLAGVLCVRARRRPISMGGRGTQIILKKFYQRKKLEI